MTNQMTPEGAYIVIPAQAVEAAAKAMLAAGNHVGGWDALPVFMQDNYLRDARAVLEAAAPHMLAGALEDAAAEVDEGVGAHGQEEYADWLRERANTYRSTK